MTGNQNLQVQASQIQVNTLTLSRASVESVVLDGAAGSTARLNNLTISSPLALSAGKGMTLRANGLSIASPGSLNLGNGRLILDYAGATPAQTLRAWVANGAVGTTPSISGASTLALVDNSRLHKTSFGGQTLAAPFSQVFIQNAMAGDVNLDGKVDKEDLLAVFANLKRTNALWIQGDLDNNGIVNLTDLAIVQSLLPAPSLSLPAASKTAATRQTKSVVKHKPHKVKIQNPKKHGR